MPNAREHVVELAPFGYVVERLGRGDDRDAIPARELSFPRKVRPVARPEVARVREVEPIREAIEKFSDNAALSPIKDYLGEDFTYGEIRAVMAAVAGGKR